MTEDKERNVISDLDDACYTKEPCTLLFYFGMTDDGESYVDAEIVSGHVQILNDEYKYINDTIGNETLLEAIEELLKELENE